MTTAWLLQTLKPLLIGFVFGALNCVAKQHHVGIDCVYEGV